MVTLAPYATTALTAGPMVACHRMPYATSVRTAVPRAAFRHRSVESEQVEQLEPAELAEPVELVERQLDKAALAELLEQDFAVLPPVETHI